MESGCPGRIDHLCYLEEKSDTVGKITSSSVVLEHNFLQDIHRTEIWVIGDNILHESSNITFRTTENRGEVDNLRCEIIVDGQLPTVHSTFAWLKSISLCASESDEVRATPQLFPLIFTWRSCIKHVN